MPLLALTVLFKLDILQITHTAIAAGNPSLRCDSGIAIVYIGEYKLLNFVSGKEITNAAQTDTNVNDKSPKFKC